MKSKDLYRIGSRLCQYYIFRKRTPLTVSYLTTYRCNQHCRYCDWGKMGSKELDTDQAIRLIESLSKNGVLKLGFAGGESLCRPDIDLLLEAAHKSGLITSLSSNGKEISNHIDSICEYVDVVQLSLDGSRVIHDEQRGKGTYDNVMSAIEILRKNGQKMITNTVLTKRSIGELHFVLDMALKYEYNALFQPVFEYEISADGSVIQDLRPDRYEMNKAIEFLIDKKRCGLPIGNSTAFLRYIQRTWENQHTIKCHANNLFCTIDPVGNVLPCCFDVAQDNRYNAAELGFTQAFTKARDNPFSKHCKGCYCNAYVESNLAFRFHISACLNALNII